MKVIQLGCFCRISLYRQEYGTKRKSAFYGWALYDYEDRYLMMDYHLVFHYVQQD